MNTDAVIGCDAVNFDAQWLHLTTLSGVVRTIPWSAIKIAGMGGNHEGHMRIQHVTDKVTPYFPTHDSLWIVYAEGGFAQVMIEKSSPKRDGILAAFAQNLGIGWHGDDLTSSELTNALFQIPVRLSKETPKIVSVMIAVTVALIIVAIAAGYVAGHRSH